MSDSRKQRHVRSFVRRQGRLTKGQQASIDALWPRFGVNIPEQSDRLSQLDDLFGRHAERILEIGFGNGDSLADMAAVFPEKDFLGIEVHRPGVGHLCMRLGSDGSENVRVICHDAVEVVRDFLPDGSLDGVHIYFPDPWHKTRHNKRRIVNEAFVGILAAKVRIGGYIHLATDWEAYAKQMSAVMKSVSGWSNTASEGDFVPRPEWRPLTKFESRGHRLGHGVWDLIYAREMATAESPDDQRIEKS